MVEQTSASGLGKPSAPLGDGGDITEQEGGDLPVGIALMGEQDDLDAQDIALGGGMRLQGLVEVDQVFRREPDRDCVGCGHGLLLDQFRSRDTILTIPTSYDPVPILSWPTFATDH